MRAVPHALVNELIEAQPSIAQQSWRHCLGACKDCDGYEVVARRVRVCLASLHRVRHRQLQMVRYVIRALGRDICDTSHLVAAVAAPIVARIWWGTRACRRVARARIGGVEVVGARARVDVPKTRAVVDLASVVKLIERGDQPRTGPIVAVVVVVGSDAGEGGIALRAITAARGAARVLYGKHLHARLHATDAREAQGGAG